MSQTPADPRDSRTTTKQLVEHAAVEIQHDRGIIYVYAHDGHPLLKITGLPKPIPELDDAATHGRQLTVDIRNGGAVCDWGPTPTVVTPDNPMPHPLVDDPWRAQRTDALDIFKQVGATITDRETD